MKKIMLLVLGILLMSSLSFGYTNPYIQKSTTPNEPDISHEDIVKELSFWNRIKYTIAKRNQALTAAGQERKCSEYADIGPVYQKAYESKRITCNNREALINAFTKDSAGRWNFVGEWSAPISLSYSIEWYWECYYCELLIGVCNVGETACYTDTSYKECIDPAIGGPQWSTPKNCRSGQVCQNRRCQSVTCIERWGCDSWGECINGVRRRTCTDQNNCGTYEAKPSTSEKCIVIDDPDDPSDPGGSTDPGTGEPQLKKAKIGYSNLKVDAKGREIITTITLKNTGDSMVDNMLLEVQVRPMGMLPLAFVGPQSVCDPKYPENVHRQFKLNKGESTDLSLTSTVSQDGEYDVYGITVNKCWADAPQGNIKLAPFLGGELLATVEIDADGSSRVVRTTGETFFLSGLIEALGFMIYPVMFAFVVLLVLVGILIYKKTRK